MYHLSMLFSHAVRRFRSSLRWLKVDSERGVSAIEYGLLASLIAVVIITAVTTLGSNLTGLFQSIASKVHS